MTTLAHISDLHFGRLDVAAAEAMIGELHALKPHLLVVSGDLTQRARRAQFAAAVGYLKRLPQPQLVVPGNHDVPLYDFLRRLFNPHGRFATMVCAEPYPVWENNDVKVVGINTASRLAPRLAGFWKDGKIRRSHLNRLEQLFRPASPQVQVLVAHHPFIQPAGGHAHGIIHGAASARDRLAALDVDLILSGHLHMSFHGPILAPGAGGPLNLMAGSATSTRRRDPHNAYNIVRIDSTRGGIEVEVRELVSGTWSTATALTLPLRRTTPDEP